MINYFICQTRKYKSYILLPDNWSGIFRNLNSILFNIIGVIISKPEEYEFNKSIIGPNRLFLHINVRPLGKDESEPTIIQTDNYFAGLAYREQYYEVTTDTINVLNKEHFTAKYYRNNNINAQYNKKYCLYIEREEFIFTAGIANITKEQNKPDKEILNNIEKIYDGIIQSLYLVQK